MNTKTILVALVVILLIVVGAYTLTRQNNSDIESPNNENNVADKVNNENEGDFQNRENIDVSPEEQGALSTYLENNISELSPEEAVLGGTFYVGSVSFPVDDIAIVDYEDGHIALTAKVNYSYDNEEVEINSFELIESNDIREVDDSKQKEDVEGISVEEQGKVNTYLENNISKLSPEEAVLGGSFQIRSVSFPEGGIAIVNYEDSRVSLTAKADYNINSSGAVEINSFELIPDGSTMERNGTNDGGICVDMCGDGVCQEMVCMGEGCPCAETAQSCSADCS